MEERDDGKHLIVIPGIYLIQIAACGNMGDGKLMDTMKIWAQRECKELGLDSKVKKVQEGNLNKLRERMKNILGEKGITKLDFALNGMINKLKT